MKIASKPAKMPRLFGAMFATAAVAACAFAGTAFAADGFEADGVSDFYDDSYALMYTEVEDAEEVDEETGETTKTSYTEYNLIDKNYDVKLTYKSTDSYSKRPEVTRYGVIVREQDEDTYRTLEGLNTYSGKKLLDVKYNDIAYNNDIDNPTVFAAYFDKDKVVLERYARGTTKAIDTLDIAVDAGDAKPYVYLNATETAVTVKISYFDSEKEESVEITKLVSYDADGMKAQDIASPENSTVTVSAIDDGLDTVVFNEVTTETSHRTGSGYSYSYDYTYNYTTLLPDGTEVTELADYKYEGNNADVTNGKAADVFLFVKTDTTKDDDGKVTNVKETAKLVDADGKVIATLPEQSVDGSNASLYWGFFGDNAYVYGSYTTYVEDEDGSTTSSYTTHLPAKIFDASGDAVKEIANVSNVYVTRGYEDKAQYLVVTAYANFDDSIKTDSYDNETGKYRYSGSFTAYYDADFNEIPAHVVTSQRNKAAALDTPDAYMLDGTKLWTGAKFAYDENDNFVQRAGQYISAVNANYSNIRVGSTDAYISTTDNGKFGIVTGDGTELAASEYDRVYAESNSEIAMVKKDGKWYFVDLSGRARAEMYRLYNPYTGEHFYTADATERDTVEAAGWTYEGVGWVAPGGSTTPVFRLYNEFGGEHHYTTKAVEREELVEAGWTDEGVGWFSMGSVPLFREYNPYMFSCNHNYTADLEEHDSLVELGWENEGVAWYGVKFLEPIGDGAETAAVADTDADAEKTSNDLEAATL